MKVRNLDHLNLTVASFDQTVDWYGRLFGFELVEEDRLEDGTRWGVIKSGDAMLCIYEHEDYRFLEMKERRQQGIHGVSHFSLRIEDRDAWLKKAEQEGVEIKYGGQVDWPHSDSWYVDDPTGYEIEVAWWREGEPRFQ